MGRIELSILDRISATAGDEIVAGWLRDVDDFEGGQKLFAGEQVFSAALASLERASAMASKAVSEAVEDAIAIDRAERDIDAILARNDEALRKLVDGGR